MEYKSFRETFNQLDKGMRPCRYPNCQKYGKVASKQHGIVCPEHRS
jgi:hypothetical protein